MTDNSVKISIAVPAYNEERKIEATINNIIKAKQKFNDLLIEIILINDGSTDLTGAICDSLSSKYDFIRVIHHPINKGLGRSIKDSINIAKGEKWAVLPGDNDTPIEAIVTLFENYEKADMVMLFFVNREIRGRKRNTISTIFNTIYLIVFDIYIQYLNGPGTFPTRLLRDMDIYAHQFSIIAEMRVKLLLQGCSFYELPTYMQTGTEASSALSLKNLKEVILTFLYLVTEIYLVNKTKYNKSPLRILR